MAKRQKAEKAEKAKGTVRSAFRGISAAHAERVCLDIARVKPRTGLYAHRPSRHDGGARVAVEGVSERLGLIVARAYSARSSATERVRRPIRLTSLETRRRWPRIWVLVNRSCRGFSRGSGRAQSGSMGLVSVTGCLSTCYLVWSRRRHRRSRRPSRSDSCSTSSASTGTRTMRSLRCPDTLMVAGSCRRMLGRRVRWATRFTAFGGAKKFATRLIA